MDIEALDDIEIYDLYQKLISSTYPPFLKKYGVNNLAIKAEEALIIDSYGKEYIDCVSGFGLFNIGHNHQKLILDIITQLKRSQLFTRPLISRIQVEAATILSDITPSELKCSFLCNSGSEAIDSAIKLARLSTGKSEIIVADNAFHGYTYGALSASGIDSFHKFFKPLLPDIVHVEFNNIEELSKNINSKTAAILLEPIQHEAGIAQIDYNYLHEARKICNRSNVILIFDEVKTGMGRTGSMFAFEHFNVTPDILVLGKALGGGIIPIGAIIARENVWNKFSLSFPMSASSFAGNVLACRALISTIEIIKQEELVLACREQGEVLYDRLESLAAFYPEIISKVSGKGLLLGLQVRNTLIAFRIAREMIKNGILIFPAFADNRTLMIEPPLIISDKQVQVIIKNLEKIIKNIGVTANEKM